MSARGGGVVSRRSEGVHTSEVGARTRPRTYLTRLVAARNFPLPSAMTASTTGPRDRSSKEAPNAARGRGVRSVRGESRVEWLATREVTGRSPSKKNLAGTADRIVEGFPVRARAPRPHREAPDRADPQTLRPASLRKGQSPLAAPFQRTFSHGVRSRSTWIVPSWLRSRGTRASRCRS